MYETENWYYEMLDEAEEALIMLAKQYRQVDLSLFQ